MRQPTPVFESRILNVCVGFLQSMPEDDTVVFPHQLAAELEIFNVLDSAQFPFHFPFSFPFDSPL